MYNNRASTVEGYPLGQPSSNIQCFLPWCINCWNKLRLNYFSFYSFHWNLVLIIIIRSWVLHSVCLLNQGLSDEITLFINIYNFTYSIILNSKSREVLLWIMFNKYIIWTNKENECVHSPSLSALLNICEQTARQCS